MARWSYKYPRPGYITFLCVMNLIVSGLLLALLALMAFGPQRANVRPDPGLEVLGLMEVVFFATCSGFMLTGANWARLVYLWGIFPATVVVAVYGFIHDPLVIGNCIWRLFWAAVWCLALTQPRANRFFTGRSSFGKSGDPDFATKRNSRDFDY
ncbi:MAG TPA: hypothetical protein VG733_13250 [Chthoniobacteraceae bacterium]|nr:hypothetical protein [Chthoniobacteraceae bacterium]